MSKYGTIRHEFCGQNGHKLDSEELGAPPYGGPVIVKPMEDKLKRSDLRLVQIVVVNRPKSLPDLDVELLR